MVFAAGQSAYGYSRPLRHRILQHRPQRSAPFVMPWPQRGNPAALLTFYRFHEWLAFISDRGLHCAIPHIVRDKYRRAQRLYLLSVA